MQTLYILWNELRIIFANCLCFHAFWFYLILSGNSVKVRSEWYFFLHTLISLLTGSNTYWFCLYSTEMALNQTYRASSFLGYIELYIIILYMYIIMWYICKEKWHLHTYTLFASGDFFTLVNIETSQLPQKSSLI